MFSRASTLLKNGIISMSYSIPAALGATAGVYCAAPGNISQIKRGRFPPPESRKDLNFYAASFGFGLLFHRMHRQTAARYQTTIDNPQNSKWYRNLVRVTTFPFRIAITEPLLTAPLYFSLSFGFCLVVYGKLMLEIESMMLEDLEEKRGKSKQEEKKKKQ